MSMKGRFWTRFPGAAFSAALGDGSAIDPPVLTVGAWKQKSKRPIFRSGHEAPQKGAAVALLLFFQVGAGLLAEAEDLATGGEDGAGIGVAAEALYFQLEEEVAQFGQMVAPTAPRLVFLRKLRRVILGNCQAMIRPPACKYAL